MSVDKGSEYRAALRWYPLEWQEEHGDAVVGIYLDRDDMESSSGPTRRERLLHRRSGIRATFVAAVRPRRIPLTIAGVVFTISATLQSYVLIQAAERIFRMINLGVVNLDVVSYATPVIIASSLAASSWTVLGVLALVRGRRLVSAGIFSMLIAGALWSVTRSPWPNVLGPVFSSVPTALSTTIGVIATTAFAAIVVGFARSGPLGLRNRWLIVGAAVAQAASLITTLVGGPADTAVAATAGLVGAFLNPLACTLFGIWLILFSHPDIFTGTVLNRRRVAIDASLATVGF